MLVDSPGGELGVALAERRHQLEVVGLAAAVLARVGVELAPADADVPLRRPPQGGQDAQVPAGGGGCEEREVELVVRLVDLVHRQLLGPELGRLPVQPIELGVGGQPARALGDLRFEPAAQPVDALQLAEVERGDGGAAAWAHLDQALILQAAQRLADRDDADLQHLGQLAERELPPGLERPVQDRPPQLQHHLVGDRARLDRADPGGRGGCHRRLAFTDCGHGDVIEYTERIISAHRDPPFMRIKIVVANGPLMTVPRRFDQA